MPRRWVKLLGWLAVLALPAGGGPRWVRAEQFDPSLPPSNPPLRAQPGKPAAGMPAAGMPTDKYLLIPGYWALNMDAVQEELRLTGEQRQQLKAISAKHQAAMQAFQAQTQKGLAQLPELSPEQQQKRMGEVQRQADQLARSARKQAEAALDPQQLRTLKKISFRLWAGSTLTNPAAQEQLGLSPQQRQRLAAVFDKATQKMEQLQRETAEQALDILSGEQELRLHEQMDGQNRSPQPADSTR
jgi:hypothetical protein